MKLRILEAGKSHPIADAIARSSVASELHVMSEYLNAGIAKVATSVTRGDTTDPHAVLKCAKETRADFAIIASEDPLAAGVADALQENGIPCIGPTKRLAQLESSKSFTRNLLSKYNIPGNPKHRVFRNSDGLLDYLRAEGDFVVKPDGLTGGKGVKVFGDHFSTVEEGYDYCRELFDMGQPAVVIEEKLDGEEFSFQSFYDGRNIAHTIPVQDHKRAFDDDKGPNTGGMGSYTCSDHLLPFLSRSELEKAKEINRAVGEALVSEVGEEYRGICMEGSCSPKMAYASLSTTLDLAILR